MKKRLASPEERRLFEKTVAASRPVLAAKAKVVARKVRREPGGAPQARLDLHGLTEAQAHSALLAFLRGARKLGLAFVLVITGKGSAVQGASRGVLKSAVPRWLNEKPFSALIRETAPAERRHGGEGALYVYLRK